jgi:transaldolase
MEKVKNVEALNVKIFADGADKAGMLEMYRKPFIQGLTTNPTLMKKAGIKDYEAFAKDILSEIKDKSISFEVFSDDFAEMRREALKIATWGENVYVKIPVTNTKGEFAGDLIRELAEKKVKLNVTAIMTLEQVKLVSEALQNHAPSYISVFAGRIADTGRDPLPLMTECLEYMKKYSQQELLWASPRELLNIYQADDMGCQIITVSNDILKKLNLVNKDLNEFSLETVKMFADDAVAAGFSLN